MTTLLRKKSLNLVEILLKKNKTQNNNYYFVKNLQKYLEVLFFCAIFVM